MFWKLCLTEILSNLSKYLWCGGTDSLLHNQLISLDYCIEIKRSFGRYDPLQNSMIKFMLCSPCSCPNTHTLKYPNHNIKQKYNCIWLAYTRGACCMQVLSSLWVCRRPVFLYVYPPNKPLNQMKTNQANFLLRRSLTFYYMIIIPFGNSRQLLGCRGQINKGP